MSLFQLESLPTGLLFHVLVEVKKIPVEESLCSAISCVFEFPKESPSSSMTLASWLSKSISSPVATNQPNVAIDGNTKDRSHTIWSLEEQECTQLIHDILKRNNTTYLLYADLGEHTSALLRENIDLSVSGDIQSHAMVGLERRNSRRRSGNCVAFASPGSGLYKILGISFLQP